MKKLTKSKLKSLLKNAKSRTTIYVVLALFLLMSSIFIYEQDVKPALLQPRSMMTVESEPLRGGRENPILLTKGTKLEQQLIMVGTELTGFSLSFQEKNETTKGEIHITLKNENGKQIAEWTLNEKDLSGEQFYSFYIDRQVVNVGEHYELLIEATEGEKSPIVLKTVDISKLENSKLIQPVIENGEKQEFVLSYRLLNGTCSSLKYYYVMVVLGLFMCLVVAWIIGILNSKKECKFVWLALILGSIYILIIPPYSVPDEGVHFATAYKYSNLLMGHQNSIDDDGKVIVDKESMNYWLREETPSQSTYARFMRGMVGKTDKSSESEGAIRRPLAEYNLGYFPQAIGITVGRMVHLNGEQILLIGRWFALFWYCFVMYWAVRIIPAFGKNILFIIGLFPMTLQQAMSYNYDSVLNGIAFFLIAYILHLAYDDKKKYIDMKDRIIIIVCIIIIATIKFIYLPLLGVGMLIPSEKFRGLKQKVLNAILFVGVGSGILLLSQANRFIPSVNVSSTVGTKTEYYTLAVCFEDPIAACKVIFKTFFDLSSNLLNTMVGSSLGWLDIPVPQLVIIGFIVLLVVCGMNYQSQPREWKMEEKVCLGGLSVLMILLVYAALLMTWTAKGAQIISGLQGRYFLPVLPLISLILQNKKIVIRGNIDTILLAGISAFQIYVVLNIFAFVVRR